MKPIENQGLTHVLGAYLYPGWRREYEDLDGAIKDFVAGEGKAQTQQALAELEQLLDSTDGEIDAYLAKAWPMMSHPQPRLFLLDLQQRLRIRAALAAMAPPPVLSEPETFVHATHFLPAIAASFPDEDMAELGVLAVLDAHADDVIALVKRGRGGRTYTADAGRVIGVAITRSDEPEQETTRVTARIAAAPGADTGYRIVTAFPECRPGVPDRSDNGLDILLGYYHIDWFDDYEGDIAGPLRDFLASEEIEVRSEALAELEAVAALPEEAIANRLAHSPLGIRPVDVTAGTFVAYLRKAIATVRDRGWA